VEHPAIELYLKALEMNNGWFCTLCWGSPTPTNSWIHSGSVDAAPKPTISPFTWHCKRPRPKKPHIVTSNVEHPAIELYLKALEMNNGLT
jgi:hypothetical protein